MTLQYLRRYKLVYLASPYTKTGNLDNACREVCIVARELYQAGVSVFSPIAHSHTIAMLSGMDPLDHMFWLDADRPLQDACDALVIVKMLGWHESDGISNEIAHAWLKKPMQPIYYLDPETMALSTACPEWK